jgi:hypothetical protein
MKNRSFAIIAAFVLLLNLTGLGSADTKSTRSAKPQAGALVAMLPASDGVVTLDAARFFNNGLPTLLSANQPALAELMAKIESIKAETGIDLRKFESVAVGFAVKPISAKEYDFDPVVIARGDIAAGGLVAVAKLASNGKYREEKIGTRTVYVFSAKDVAQKNAPKTANSKAAGFIERALNGLTREIAVTSLDANTLAFGSLPRVRQTVEAKTRVDADITGLLLRNPNAILNFAARTPTGLSQFLSLDNDELGKNLSSIRFLWGSMDLVENNAVVRLMARTARADQAQSLFDTVQGLQVVGKALIGGSKGADKQVYARMIDNAKIAKAGNDVTLDLAVPQADIDILVGQIK